MLLNELSQLEQAYERFDWFKGRALLSSLHKRGSDWLTIFSYSSQHEYLFFLNIFVNEDLEVFFFFFNFFLRFSDF